MVHVHNMEDYGKIIVPFLLIIVIALYGIGKRKRDGDRINYCKVDDASKKNCSILIDKASTSLPMNDRLSELPDEILSHLITYLSLRDAARMATLSKKWRKVSLSPCLDLDWRTLSGIPRCYHSDDCELYKETYMKGVDQVLRNYKDHDKDHDITSFRLQSCCLDNKYTVVNRWINFAAENKFLQSLTLQFVCQDGVPIDSRRKYNVFHVISGSFLSQFSYLKNLHLHSCILRLENDFRLSKLLLTSLDLCDVILEGTQWQGFLSSLSTLESLSLRHINLPKKLCIDYQLSRLSSLRIELCAVRELELSARNLKTFHFVFYDPVECSFSCASSLENVYIFPGSQDNTAGVILDSLAAKASNLKSLYVRGNNSLVHKLPSCRGLFFQSVLNFHISIWTANNNIMQAVPHLLKSFPLLKKLEVEFPPWPDYETRERYEVLAPFCHDNLKEVELSYFQERWIPVATFLLQSAIGLNCMVLTKLPRKYGAAQGWCMTDDELSDKECEIIRKALAGKASSPYVQVTVGKVSL